MPQTGDDDGPRTLQTVSTASQVMRTLKELDGAGVTELATELDISKSTAHIHLMTLVENGLVVKRDSKYELALRLFAFGEYVRSRNPLYRHGKPQVDELADKTGQYVHIVTEESGRAINLYQVKGDTSVSGEYQTSKPQQRDRLHYTASGKAILAFLPKQRVNEIIDRHGLPERTSNTVTDPDALFEELTTIHERGYAYNDEEEIEGFRAIGAPIRTPDGGVLGSLSVSGPTSVLQEERFEETLPEKVVNSANVIEVNINMSSRS
ncbi:IclR family transcriptional regulator [Haloarcula sp. JP-Z28]|uniref:IclR family transcriptional regulator n=1 Tax=Haloarcula sp. JP-Z28 TaxID=2716715 RepID=UPI0014047DF9|nr:IclR family transcriptional regulator [Haloarcula sp. JP-Z28]NHN65605.1 IclR family transcriptional regulator [Haloarcula sp. JP-Z28]